MQESKRLQPESQTVIKANETFKPNETLKLDETITMNETINTNDTLRVGVKLIKTGCVAMDGPGKGLPCVFPFKYDDVTYNTCTNRNKFLTNNIPWCSTKVNEGGYHIQGEGNWGNCDETCPLPLKGIVAISQ